jgi:hypothetical protein
LPAKKPLKPSPVGSRTIDLSQVKAIGIGDEHVSAREYDYFVTRPDAWLMSSAALLRAAKAVLRQTVIDDDARQTVIRHHIVGAPSTAWMNRASHILAAQPGCSILNAQVALLASLAVENALKALVVARTLAAGGNPSSGRLPKALKCHDLQNLASRVHADLAPINDFESELLAEGGRFIEYLGRYPVPLAAKDFPVGSSVHPRRVCSASEAIFLRAVAEAARLMHALDPALQTVPVSTHVRNQREIFAEKVGYVFEPLRGEAQVQLDWKRRSTVKHKSRWKRASIRTRRSPNARPTRQRQPR